MSVSNTDTWHVDSPDLSKRSSPAISRHNGSPVGDHLTSMNESKGGNKPESIELTPVNDNSNNSTIHQGIRANDGVGCRDEVEPLLIPNVQVSAESEVKA